jgi:hypothetical protein
MELTICERSANGRTLIEGIFGLGGIGGKEELRRK